MTTFDGLGEIVKFADVMVAPVELDVVAPVLEVEAAVRRL